MQSIDWSKAAIFFSEVGGELCFATAASCSHNGESLLVSANLTSGQPATWSQPPAGGDAGLVLVAAQSNTSNDSTEGSLHLNSADETFNYAMSGTVSQTDDGFVIAVTVTCYQEINVHIAGSNVASVSGNVVSITATAPYAVSTDANGKYVVLAAAPAVTDQSVQLDYSQLPPFVMVDPNGIEEAHMQIAQAAAGITQNLAGPFAQFLNADEIRLTRHSHPGSVTQTSIGATNLPGAGLPTSTRCAVTRSPEARTKPAPGRGMRPKVIFWIGAPVAAFMMVAMMLIGGR